jgi:propane 2-monooxygenase large subunit
MPQPHLRFDDKQMWTLDHVKGNTLGSPLRGFRALDAAGQKAAADEYRKGFKVNPV